MLAERTITFDALMERLERAQIADVAGWLGHAIERGAIEELPPERFGPRRFQLRPAGMSLLEQTRRAEDHHDHHAPAA
jgi:hypothetical protein